jgi:hypothetical protein
MSASTLCSGAELTAACGLQAADFLFGAAQPHDPQFEQLFRLFAAGNLGAASAALAISVRACTHGDGTELSSWYTFMFAHDTL